MIAPVKQIFDFHLTREERESPVWLSLKDRLERKLVELRTHNDNPKLTDVETATLRGHIQLLKAFIALGAKPPAMTAPSARPGPRQDLGAKYG